MGIIFISSVLVTTGVFLITIMKGFDLLMTKTFPAAFAMKGIEEQRLEDKWRCFSVLMLATCKMYNI